MKIGVAAGAVGTALYATWRLGTPSFVDIGQTRGGHGYLEEFKHTTCWIGKQDCGMVARCVNGLVVSFEGLPGNPRNVGTLCPKGVAQIMSLYDPNRVKTPLVRTNAKGQTGEWRRASWDEALTLVANEINRVRAIDSKLILWQKGRSKAKDFYDTAFVGAIGATKLGHGAYCSDAGYRAAEYTCGPHGVLHPDFRYTRHLLAWGWNITAAGGNKFCWIVWPRQMLEAKERGIKIVHIDPRLRSAGPHADEWLAIRPGTDLALALALCNQLVELGFLDTEYLTEHTNSPYLVGPDGMFHRVGDVVQVWDLDLDAPIDHSTATDPALEGEFDIGGTTYKTAFRLFKEHVAQYTPEWAAGVCGLEAEAIRRVAREIGENAMIGSVVDVDGTLVPYRPVGVMAYHMSQQELGFQALRAMIMVYMLVGAVGAAGGVAIDSSWKIDKNYAGLDTVTIGDGPYNFYLKGSKYFPINSGLPGVYAKVMQDPARYNVDALPEMAILHMVNPLVAFPSIPDFEDAYSRMKFVAVITPFMSEVADHYADVVLPCATLEKYEGPISAYDMYEDAKTLRLPPMDPLYESRGEIDIYIDLCEKAGVLYGDGGYLDRVNESLGLEDPYALSTSTKPTVRGIFDNWSKAQGLPGIEYFEEKGVWHKGAIKPTKYYGYATSPPFHGKVHRLYGESLLRYQNEMKAKLTTEPDAGRIYWQDYTPFPTWRAQTLDGSPSEYDLYLISYKLVEHKQARTSYIPLLTELSGGARLDINPKTARERGIADGDMVFVESQNAVTGETRRVEVRAALTEGIRPDTVGMPHHFGMWSHPGSRGLGPSPNSLYFTGEGYWTNTADQSFLVRVKVWTSGGGA